MTENNTNPGIFDTEFTEIFKGIFDHTPNGIVVADKDCYIKLFNTTAEKLTGMKVEDVMDSYFHDVFPQIPQLKGNGNVLLNENTTVVLINGKELHTKIFTIKEQDEIAAVIYIMQDLSEIIQLTMELEKSKQVIQELADIIESSFDGVLVTDGSGNFLMANKSYERITGIGKDELVGRNMKELINPVWMKNSVVFLAIKEQTSISLPHTTRHGKNIIVTGTPVFGSDGEIKKVIVNARDISEIYELREELLKAREMEKIYFKNLCDNKNGIKKNGGVVVVSEVMQEIFSLAHKVSSFDATILVLGESGVGKEEITKFIHKNSLRKDKPLVVINCGAIPEHLLESELFGYERGAFTGALKEGKTGLFEAANGGILFLDEIGEMPLSLQVKLLRVLESREIVRVGAVNPISVDVRIIAATNKNLEEKVKNGEFREDLFYRLNVIQIKLPALRERIEDIAPLALHFLQSFNLRYGQSKKLTYDVIKELEQYSWPGNIRQLKNVVENMVIVSNNEYLQINDLPWHKKNEEPDEDSVKKSPEFGIIPLEQAIEQVEREILRKAKEKFKSTRKIAQAIQVDQSTVVRKMKKYGLASSGDEEMQP